MRQHPGKSGAGKPSSGAECGIIFGMSKETDMVGKVRRVAYAGMAVNVAVAALKGIAGVAFASQATRSTRFQTS